MWPHWIDFSSRHMLLADDDNWAALEVGAKNPDLWVLGLKKKKGLGCRLSHLTLRVWGGAAFSGAVFGILESGSKVPSLPLCIITSGQEHRGLQPRTGG